MVSSLLRFQSDHPSRVTSDEPITNQETLTGGWGRGQATLVSTIHDERYSRASLASPFNGYESSFFELKQRPPFRIWQDAPFLDHQIGDNEPVGLPQTPNVPQCQSD
jgi:hypothetical protein